MSNIKRGIYIVLAYAKDLLKSVCRTYMYNTSLGFRLQGSHVQNRIFHKKRGYSLKYSHLPLACQAEACPDVFLHVCNLLLLMSVTVFTPGNG